jgi:hypothetical protein
MGENGAKHMSPAASEILGNNACGCQKDYRPTAMDRLISVAIDQEVKVKN